MMNTKKNATKNANTEGLDKVTAELNALYADLCEAEQEVDVLARMLEKANERAVAIETRISFLEEKMAKEIAKSYQAAPENPVTKTATAHKSNKETATEPTAKTAHKSKKSTKKSSKKPTAKTETAKTETETADDKTEQRRAARAVGRDNKAKYARWEKEAAKKLPVYDKPNHLVAYVYYDENGTLLGRKPIH